MIRDYRHDRTTRRAPFRRIENGASQEVQRLFERVAPTIERVTPSTMQTSSAFTRDAAQLRTVMENVSQHLSNATRITCSAQETMPDQLANARVGEIPAIKDLEKKSVPMVTVLRPEEHSSFKESHRHNIQTREKNLKNAQFGENTVNEECLPGSSSQSFSRYDPVSTAGPDTVPPVRKPKLIEPEPIPYTPRRVPDKQRIRILTLGSAVAAGTLIAVGLYAGGGDLLSRFFSNNNEGITTENPATITERPKPPASRNRLEQPLPTNIEGGSTILRSIGVAQQEDASVDMQKTSVLQAQQPSVSIGGKETTIPSKQTTTAPKVETEIKAPRIKTITPSPERPNAPITRKFDEQAIPNESKQSTSAEPFRHVGKMRTTVSGIKEEAKEKPVSQTSTSYTVQVRATSDETEANLIAKKLKRRGMGDVMIVTSQKNGKQLYKVQYGSYKSSVDAQSAATASGYEGSWVVKQP